MITYFGLFLLYYSMLGCSNNNTSTTSHNINSNFEKQETLYNKYPYILKNDVVYFNPISPILNRTNRNILKDNAVVLNNYPEKYI